MTMINPKKKDAAEDDAEELSSGVSEDEQMDEAPAEDAQMESDANEDDDQEEDASEKADGEEVKEVFIPGKQTLADDEELVMDHSAYVLYQQATTAAPCLSFDILRDQLGDNRADVFPLTAYIVAGTQAESHEQNNLLCMKLWNMHRIDQSKTAEDSDEDDEDDESDDDDDELNASDKKPKLSLAYVPHPGAINRVRVQEFENGKKICASWSENGSVYLTDITEAVAATEKSELLTRYVKNKLAPEPFFKFSGHKKEGFGLDWSPVVPGQLASGDCYRNIHIWRPADGGSRFKVDERPFTGHTDSVEDIQWSPNEASVLASCSVDKSIRIFDIRANPAKACMLSVPDAHTSDVNVIAWSRVENTFLISGGDDGAIKVWDLRQFKTGKPVSLFDYHKAPITSVEWHPTDGTVFTASSEDDCVTLWDLAIEQDADEAGRTAEGDGVDDLPPQLLFIHQGQQEVKECHWHPQMPGVLLSTAHSGFNIFRTISV